MSRPAFRKPWEHGAKAYHEADSLEAVAAGCKRKRAPFTVLIHHSTHALDGVACGSCGHDLAGSYPLKGSGEPDTYAMCDVDPKRGTFKLTHYYCAWAGVMGEVMKLREYAS